METRKTAEMPRGWVPRGWRLGGCQRRELVVQAELGGLLIRVHEHLRHRFHAAELHDVGAAGQATEVGRGRDGDDIKLKRRLQEIKGDQPFWDFGAAGFLQNWKQDLRRSGVDILEPHPYTLRHGARATISYRDVGPTTKSTAADGGPRTLRSGGTGSRPALSKRKVASLAAHWTTGARSGAG